VPEDYVHRIGRTGRAGSNGVAMSLVCHEEKPLLADIERTTRNRIESVIIEGFEPGTHHRDETDTRDAARGARPGSNSRNPKRSGARNSTPGRAKQAEQPNSHSTRAAQPVSADQPAKPAKRRRSGRKHKRTATAENQASAAASSAQSRPFQSALRAVASIFGGAGQRDN
jgi:ATP-dependent RNA helicase RhlE